MTAILAPVLVQAGAGMLAEIVLKRAPGVARVIEKVAGRLGVEATEEAIVDRFRKDPDAVTKAAIEVEAEDPATWSAMAAQAALLSREDERETAFSWAWRPAMSWLLLFLWLWNAVLVSLVNAITRSEVEAIPWEQLVGFSGLWLAIYGGGNTIKSIWAKN